MATAVFAHVAVWLAIVADGCLAPAPSGANTSGDRVVGYPEPVRLHLPTLGRFAGNPGTGQGDEGFGGVDCVAGVATGLQGKMFTHVADMHVIPLIEGDARSLLQIIECQPAGKVAVGKAGRTN